MFTRNKHNSHARLILLVLLLCFLSITLNSLFVLLNWNLFFFFVLSSVIFCRFFIYLQLLIQMILIPLRILSRCLSIDFENRTASNFKNLEIRNFKQSDNVTILFSKDPGIFFSDLLLLFNRIINSFSVM